MRFAAYLLVSVVALAVVASAIQEHQQTNVFSGSLRQKCYKKSSEIFQDRIKSPLPSEYITEVPTSWNWANVSGVNYLTMNRNQHIPQYTLSPMMEIGGCWAFASTSALSDRINIIRRAVWPQVNLAPQHLINCNGGGTCDGGDPRAAYEFMAESGIVDETCQPYQAVNGLACTPACKTCNPDGTCVAIQRYTNITVDEVGKVSGEKEIMAEVYARGPVACSIDATDKLESYTGGIFKEFVAVPIPNHIVSIVGWGEENGESYWIVRNSWGMYYGEQGFFRIVRGSPFENLGIELDCAWATPNLKGLPAF
ncbi:cathepsin Z precursor [Heterostelium album PN500]|uniref:cathepsin X n=1 Tax=Heterostelium pallidum (strain ATCC 26659 / Pp 5 / PN500) TaxID=670386 RepID=D3B5M9_HETP5|nr:cathepsin Z precursor [Heterostelium album PN500]EFA83177.1 cathepsin Z precursor [Heterostelium album PN500]|eukprot:XP_020435294.1 cathepsin Z precursor [Heterostelium album PN500]